MKIISSFKDYYDCVSSDFVSSFDNHLYIREEEEIVINMDSCDLGYYSVQQENTNPRISHNNGLDKKEGILIISGEAYPFINIKNNSGDNPKCIFNFEEVNDELLDWWETKEYIKNRWENIKKNRF
ncbi:MAG: hypothetical protein LBV51_00375 [Acholeplasmatales bacterium]|jgi:hypothetical protein|nr:hypothetical protein [Acholeplasmatales bacterium]